MQARQCRPRSMRPALMLSRDADKLDPAAAQAEGHAIISMAQFTRPEAKNVQVDSTLSSPQQGSFVLHVSASATVDTTVCACPRTDADERLGERRRRMGHQEARARAGPRQYRLDGVERQARGAQDRVAQPARTRCRTPAKQPGDVKVAIIPFDRMVNIGTGFKDEFWIDYTVKNIQKDQWNGCVIDRDQSNDVQDTTPVSTNYHTFFPAAAVRLAGSGHAAERPTGPRCTAKIDADDGVRQHQRDDRAGLGLARADVATCRSPTRSRRRPISTR